MFGLSKLMRSKVMRWIAGIATGATTALGAWTGWMTYEQQSGGLLSMQYNGEVVSGKNTRNLVICVDSTVVEKNFSSICPNFYNSRKYTVRDLSLRYELQSRGIQFEPTGMYSLSDEGEGVYMLRYNLDKLASYETTSPPVRKFIIPENGGEVTMRAMASFDGADSLMTYRVNAKFVVVDNGGTYSFAEWRTRCQRQCNKQMSDGEYDAYYLSLRYRESDYRYNVPLEESKQTVADTNLAKNEEPAVKKEPAKQEQNAEQSQSQSAEKYEPEKYSDTNVDLSNVQFYTDTVTHVAIRRNGHQAVVMLIEDTVTHKFANFVLEFNNANTTANVWDLAKNTMLRNFAYLDADPTLGEDVEYEDDKYYNDHREAIGLVCGNFGQPDYRTFVVKPKSSAHADNYGANVRYYRLPEHVLCEDNKPIGVWTSLRKSGMLWVIVGNFLFVLVLPIFDKDDRDGMGVVEYYSKCFISDILPIAFVISMVWFVAFLIYSIIHVYF